MNKTYSKSKVSVSAVENSIGQMKNEIASELGVHLGPDATARQNGAVGGEITKRLVSIAQNQLSGR